MSDPTIKPDSTLSPPGGEAGSLPVDSHAPTAVPSENPSIAYLEDEKGTPNVSSQDKNGLNSPPRTSEEPEKAPDSKGNEEDEPDYVTGLPLLIIIVGLCLAVLLVALVCPQLYPESAIREADCSNVLGQYHHCYRYP